MCEICEDTKRVRVLDVWRISRSVQASGIGLEAFDHFPFVPGGAPCPKCVGEDEFDNAIDDMNQKWGNPYNPTSTSEDES